MASSSAETVRESIQASPSNLKAKFEEAEEKIAILLRRHIEHGNKQRVAELSGLRGDVLSFQFAGKNHIDLIAVMAGLHVLKAEKGLEAVVDAIRRMFDGESPEFREREGKAVVFEYPDGQIQMSFE